MKSTTSRLTVAAMTVGLLFALAGCTKSADESVAENAAAATEVPPGMVRGTVLETMNSGGYTYVFMETAQDQRWVAARLAPVQVGDIVQTDMGMPMSEFESKTRKRDPLANHWVVDGNLVTGQNQNAAPMVAREMMQILSATDEQVGAS